MYVRIYAIIVAIFILKGVNFMSKGITKCEVVAFKTVFPDTKRIGVVPGKKSTAYKAIKEMRGKATTKEDIQPWLNAPVLVFYNEAGDITYMVYRATCITNDIGCFWKPQLCLLPVEAYYAGDLIALEKGRFTTHDNEQGVATLAETLKQRGVILDLYEFTEALKTLKTEKIFNNRWSTLCCQNIELIKTGWHIGSYYDMFIETLLATKDLDKMLYTSTVAVGLKDSDEKEWFYLIPSIEVRYGLSEVPTTLTDIMQFGVASGLCITNSQGGISFTNEAGEHYYAFSKTYMDDYKKCFKANPDYTKYVFSAWNNDDSQAVDEDIQEEE